MRYLIVFIVFDVALNLYACNISKRQAVVSMPSYYTNYDPVYNFDMQPSYPFLEFNKQEERLSEYDRERIPVLFSKLDSLKILNHLCDTIFDVQFDSGDGKPFYYVRTRNGTMGEYYSRGFVSAYRLNPTIERITYCFNGNPEERFGQGIVENPDSVLLSIIYQWDMNAVSDFLKYGMAKFYTLEVFKYVLCNGIITDIQGFSAINNLYGREINITPIYLR